MEMLITPLNCSELESPPLPLPSSRLHLFLPVSCASGAARAGRGRQGSGWTERAVDVSCAGVPVRGGG